MCVFILLELTKYMFIVYNCVVLYLHCIIYAEEFFVPFPSTKLKTNIKNDIVYFPYLLVFTRENISISKDLVSKITTKKNSMLLVVRYLQ
jgi:hypothetical protein